jgi:AcrR family transcriptional regulator
LFGIGRPTMSSVKTDRRVRRTRELLRSALVSLILEQGYEGVTVQDILDRADVGRSTFYAHYRDKDDLLLSGVEEFRSAFTAETDSADLTAGRKVEFLEPVLAVFRHADGHRQVYKAMVGKRGAEVFVRFLHENLTDLMRAHFRAQLPERTRDDEQLAIAVQFVVSALIGLLDWWTLNDTPYTAEDMYMIFKRLTTQGVKRFLATS